jgi:hypothetical protein
MTVRKTMMMVNSLFFFFFAYYFVLAVDVDVDVDAAVCSQIMWSLSSSSSS